MVQTIEELLKSSMRIISTAGIGRDLIQQALEAANMGDTTAAETMLSNAFEQLKSAHIEQTKVMQSNMMKEDEESAGLLFTHAQDTLMSINSEYYLALQLVKMITKLNERIDRLERLLDEKTN